MYKTLLKKGTAIALALVMATSTIANFPVTAHTTEEVANPYVTGGRIRNTETVPLNWDLAHATCEACGVVEQLEFDPNRPWYQDDEGTIWQDGIPFANMDDVFIFDNVVPLQRRLHDWQDRRITSSDQDLINMADRLILAYLHNNNLTLEEALAISHVELPFIILNGEAIRMDRRGIAFTEISDISIHPLARENPRMFNPVYQPDFERTSTVRSNLTDGIVVPIYHSHHPGGYVFAHEFARINEFGETHLKVRRVVSEDTPASELALMWIYDADPRTRITFIENYPEQFRIFNTWEVMSSFAVWDFETMEFLPMSAATSNYITPLSSAAGGIWHTQFSSITPHPVGSPDDQWFVWFSARGDGDYRVWFSDFTVMIGDVMLFAYCGNPWQATPSSMQPGQCPEAQGLTGQWPWRADEPVHSSVLGTRRHARIATGGRGTAVSDVQAEYRYPMGDDVFERYWDGGAAIVVANSGDHFSNLSTMGMGGAGPNPAGGEVTVIAERGVPFTLDIAHAFGENSAEPGRGSLGAFLIADTSWFSASSFMPNTRFAIAYYDSWTFTVSNAVDEEYIVVYFTPVWAESLAGGWRAQSGNHQDIWFALPWFEWRIIIELEECPPITISPEEAIALAPLFGLSVNLDPSVLDCITDIEPLVGTWEDYGASFDLSCIYEEEWEFHVQGYLVPQMISMLLVLLLN